MQVIIVGRIVTTRFMTSAR